MSVAIKSEPMVGVVELSSDDEETVSTLSTINNEIPNNGLIGRSSTPDSQCSICLDDLTNECHTNSCRHSFCYECLLRWSKSMNTCPLCKKPFESIYHSFSDLGVYETYSVPELSTILSSRTPLTQPINEMPPDIDRMFRMNLFWDLVRRNDRVIDTGPPLYDVDDVDDIDHNQNSSSPFLHDPSDQLPSQATRIQVYIDDAWAIPLPDTTGRFRDCSLAFYRDNPAQTYRLHSFILRDLVAVRESVRLEGQSMPFPLNADVYVTNMIMRSLGEYEIRQLHLVELIRRFLDMRAVHFCHELYNFANSPYDIGGYDRNVQYSYPPHDIELTRPYYTSLLPPIHVVGETIVLDSDNEEVIRPRIMEVIEVSSSGDDSDVEILSHSFRTIDSHNSASIDQPSTSTGIRDSLDRPNNRYNLRRRRIFIPNDPSGYPVYGEFSHMSYSSQVRRGRSILDSSSDDEESITGSRGSQTALIKSQNITDKRKKKTKRNKKKRKINTNDSQSETCSTNRSRSYSGSSSSSGETDIRPFNGCILRV